MVWEKPPFPPAKEQKTTDHMKLKHEPKTGAMNSPLGVYFTPKILLLHCGKWSLSPLILAIKGESQYLKASQETWKHDHSQKSCCLPAGLCCHVASRTFSPFTRTSDNYIAINLSCWKCSPGVLVETAPGWNVLQRRDTISSSVRNVSTHYRVTLCWAEDILGWQEKKKTSKAFGAQPLWLCLFCIYFRSTGQEVGSLPTSSPLGVHTATMSMPAVEPASW